MEPAEGNGGFGLIGGESAELERLEAAYARIQARDGTAERRAWHWQMTAMVAIVGLIGLGVWDHVDKRSIPQPFVQTVVQQEDGHLVSLGVPQDLLAYEPQEGIWLEMVSEWIRRHRWRGKDVVLAQADLAWVQYHTCGSDARRLLSEEQQWFKPEKPETVGQTLVMVELKSVTRTPSPLSYQVLWKETTVPKHLPPEVKTYTATLTTGRIYPSSQEMLLQNRLGLCVTAYDISPQP
jgi:type IV secretory pathway TrbF-like protein